MPSLFHIAGPAVISVRPNGIAVAPLELGFCERAPEIQFDPEYEGTLNAAGGTQYGSIYTYQGAEANIDVLLTRYDLAVLSQFAKHFGYSWGPAGNPAGVTKVGITNEPGLLGVAALYSSPPAVAPNIASVSVLIGYPFVNQTVEFPVCLVRAVRVADIGTVPRKLFIRFRAVRVFDGATFSYVGFGPTL
jgi:hypothetical protein